MSVPGSVTGNVPDNVTRNVAASTVRAVVLRSAGTNCDQEAVHALRRAGADVDLVHVREFIEDPEALMRFGIVCLPGGFSFGDDIASGVVYAVLLREKVTPALRRLVADGGLVIGICNGFQILTRAGLLPDTQAKAAVEATLLANASNQFECRWVRLEATTDRCAWLAKGQTIDCPVAHGEGRFVVADPSVRERMQAAGQFALRYVNPAGCSERGSADYPWNPNGSPDDVAGVCDPTGRILGLMPHPERNVEPWHHPRWTRGEGGEATIGVEVFRNGVRAARHSRSS